VVEPASEDRPRDQHTEGAAGQEQPLRPGWGDTRHGGEDDVRPEAEGDGPAYQRGPEEAGHHEHVHEESPRDGFLQVQVLQLEVDVLPDGRLALYTPLIGWLSILFHQYQMEKEKYLLYFLLTIYLG